MNVESTAVADPEPLQLPQTEPPINLRDPILAGVLAWLIPGAGHLYQRRYGKGGLMMACILGTFFFGLYLGQGRVVYASWREQDTRYVYVFQVCAGLPALPALVQALRMTSEPPKAPLWGGFMAPPILPQGQIVARSAVPENLADNGNLFDPVPGIPDLLRSRGYDQLSEWQLRLAALFELGTLYTVVAGLLNVMAIYDAICGPMPPGPRTGPTTVPT